MYLRLNYSTSGKSRKLFLDQRYLFLGRLSQIHFCTKKFEAQNFIFLRYLKLFIMFINFLRDSVVTSADSS